MPRYLTFPARPEAIRVSVHETAVVDVQNTYASTGGYVDFAGFDVSGAAATVERIGKVLETARSAGVQIVFLQNGWDPEYVEAGGPGSPNWHKSNALKTMQQRPELRGLGGERTRRARMPPPLRPGKLGTVKVEVLPTHDVAVVPTQGH